MSSTTSPTSTLTDEQQQAPTPPAEPVIPLPVTVFDDVFAYKLTVLQTTLDDFAQSILDTQAPSKKQLPLFKLALFGSVASIHGSLRHDANVLEVLGVEGDYDGEVYSIETAVEILYQAGIPAVVYTSPSQTAEKPRWRVVLPFSRALPPDQRAQMMSRLAGLFGDIEFGPESWALSQSYFYGGVKDQPLPEVYVIPGERFIDLCDELDAIAKPRPKNKSNKANDAAGSGPGDTQDDWFDPGPAPADEAALRARIATGGQQTHNALVSLAGVLAWRGMGKDAIIAELKSALEARDPAARNEKWPKHVADVPRIAQGIVEKHTKQQQQSGANNNFGFNPTAQSTPPAWTTPQPLPIPLLPVPPFDPAWLPARVRQFCRDIANGLPCPFDYPAVNLLVTLGILLGNKLLVQAKYRNSWLEAANFWALIVGVISQMKTPSSQPFEQLLDRLQERSQRLYELAMAQWHGAMFVYDMLVKQMTTAFSAQARAAAQAAVRGGRAVPPAAPNMPQKPPEPQLAYYYTADVSYQKLGEFCRDNPYGVLVSNDEISGLLFDLSQREHRMDRTFYMKGHNGTSTHHTGRIGRGVIALKRFAVGVLGNIQPDPLCLFLVQDADHGRNNDGFAQRFSLSIWPDPVPLDFVDLPPTHGALQQVQAIYDAFAELDPHTAGAEDPPGDWKHFIRLEPAAHAAFVTWLKTENFPARQNPDNATMLQAHLGKFPKLVLGLGLVLHLIDLVQPIAGAPPGDPQGIIPLLTPVSLSAIERGIAISRYAEQHARRVYHAGTDPALTTARLLAQRIIDGLLAGTVTARMITRHTWSGLSNPDRVADGMAVLEELGWTRGKQLRPGPQGGRPTVEWAINPLGKGASI